MCKIKYIFDDFLEMEISTNNSMTSVYTIFYVLQGGVEILDRLEKFTPSRNKVWKLPLHIENAL